MRTILLENLNLSENEHKVMKVLLELKLPQNVTFIAQKAGIPRTTTLYILNNFQKRKLAVRKLNFTGHRRYQKKISLEKNAHINYLKPQTLIKLISCNHYNSFA